MRAKESREMYLEIIYRLGKRNDIVRSIDIAKELGYSKPSVSRAMGVLKKSGYITHSPYGDINLTDEGRKKARQIFYTHKLLTEFLTSVLKIDASVAEEDACRIEHVVSDELMNAIEAYLKENK